MIVTTTDNRKWQYGRPTGSTYISGTKIDSVKIQRQIWGFQLGLREFKESVIK